MSANPSPAPAKGSSMDTITTEVPTVAGTPFAGGFYAGRLLVAGVAYALIVAPRGEGEHDEASLSESLADVPGARSFFDGAANTAALAEAGSELAKWAQDLRIGGLMDWYLPSRDELEILYRPPPRRTTAGAATTRAASRSATPTAARSPRKRRSRSSATARTRPSKTPGTGAPRSPPAPRPPPGARASATAASTATPRTPSSGLGPSADTLRPFTH